MQDTTAEASGARIGYARVSTDEQDPQHQVAALEAAGCARVFVDRASGAKADRPSLKACLDYLRPGDTLLVTRLDRLARSLADLLRITEGLRERGVAFAATEQPVDTTTAAGRLFFGQLALFAEFERSLLLERQRAGIERAKAAGKYRGRPPLAEAIQKDIRDLAARGMKPTQIARILRISRTSVHRYTAEKKPALRVVKSAQAAVA